MHGDEFSALANKLDDLGKAFDNRLDDLGKTTSNIWKTVGGIDKRLAVVETKTEHLDKLPTMAEVQLEIANCREGRPKQDQTGAIDVPAAVPEKESGGPPSWSTVAKIVVAILATGASVAATLAAAM